MLTTLGVGEFDEQVYRALLNRPDQRLSEIATLLGATPGRVRNAAVRLTELGLVRRIKPGEYLPVGPDTALAALLHQRRMEAESAFSRVRTVVDDFARLYHTGRLQTDLASLVEVLSGRDMVDRRVDEMTKSIRTHMWVLDKPPYLEWAKGRPETNEKELEDTLAMIDRGVEIRTVYCPEAMERPGRFETVAKLATLGEQARMLPSLPFKLRIMDRKVALVPLVDEVYDTLALVHPSGLLDALIKLFELYWEQAEPIVGAHPPPDDGPGEEDLLLLHMLKAGLKDQAIARQLGVSPRTATRRIAGLMTTLGAANRFQAGVEAAARGWL